VFVLTSNATAVYALVTAHHRPPPLSAVATCVVVAVAFALATLITDCLVIE
jgi:hypothetical protein